MIVHQCVQGSKDWLLKRIGVVTASRADNLITPKTLKPSTSAEGYAHELIAETLLGAPLDDVSGGWMDRGNLIEIEARRWYAIQAIGDVAEAGFVTNDEGDIGCSPDALVGSDGGAEIKSPSIKVHVGNLLDREAFIVKHRLQVQFCLMVTGREWWDLVSYCPGQTAVVERILPDEDIINKLGEAARDVARRVREGLERIRAMGPFAHIEDETDRAVARLFA